MIEPFPIILAGCIVLAVLEFFDDKPPMWVVKFRMWLNRSKK